MPYTLSTRSLENLRGVDPRMIDLVKYALSVSTQDFGVTDVAYRTAAYQNQLFKRGLSQLDGYNKKSNHQSGRAVDLTPYVAGSGFDVNSIPRQLTIAVAMSLAAKHLDLGLIWGGNWYEDMRDYGSSLSDIKAAPLRYNLKHPGSDFNDWPHFELIK